MEKCCLVGSPNWYLSQVLDCSWDNKVAFGALSSLVILDSSNISNPRIINQAHSGKILSVSFPPQGCGSRLLTTADTGEAYVWNLDTQKVAFAYKSPQKNAVYGSWSPVDENLIVCVDDNGNLVQWKVQSNVMNGKTFKEHSFVVVSCCPHNRDLVATGTRQGLVCVINIKVPGKEYVVHKMRGHDSEVVSLSWCPVPQNLFNSKNQQDCFLLASGAKERKIFFWRAGGDGLYEAFAETPLVPRTQPGLKLWNCVCWQAPAQILVSTVGGEVLSLNLAKFNPKKGLAKAGWTNFTSAHNRCHVVVKSSPWISKEGESDSDWRLQNTTPYWVWTFGADRVMTGTCSNKDVAPIKLNTIGGAVHSMTISPIDGTSLAIGGADKTIRVVNLSEPQLKTMQTFNQKVSGKVMSLSWHPSKDGWLAYGTSDGRIGIQFTCSVKPPLLFRPFTKDSIYAMEWGPSLASIKSSFDSAENTEGNDAKAKPSNHVLYAVGGGSIAIMDPNKPDYCYDEPFKTVLKSILKPQSLKAKNKSIGLSDLAWKPDFSLLALGDEAGSIHLFCRSKEELHLVASIKVHSSLIQDISWHPQCCASDTSDMSPQANWLASASNDVNICILDVSSVYDVLQVSPEADDSLPISDVPCIATLKGHKSRVAKLAWSPHEGGRLLSASYDYCAQVWDVINRQPVASYHHHNAPLLCCEWSPFKASLAITAGQEGIVCIWDVEEQEAKLPIAKNKETNHVLSDAKESSARIPGNQSEESYVPKVQVIKKKEKTLLPLSGPEMQNEDGNYAILQYLLGPPGHGNMKLDKDGLASDGKTMPLHYAFFANQSAVEHYLMMEAKSSTVPENSFTLNVWNGSIKDAITEAIEKKALNSFIVSIAPTVSHKIWVETCAAYAEQLIEANEHSKASAYLLAIHKVEEAIQVLAQNGKYRHAVAVARCRLPPESPLIKSLLLDWAQLCVSQGQQSLAAVCFASAGEWAKAAQCLARKKTSDRLLMAARIVKEKCPEDPIGCFYARECFDLSLSLRDWTSAEAVLNLYPKLNHLALYHYVHMLIYSFKDSFTPDDWLKLGNKESQTNGSSETEAENVHVSICFGDEKVAALQKDLATEVSVTSEDSAWYAVSSKVTLAYLAAPTLFPRIKQKFVIDKATTDQDLQAAYRLLVQAVSLLYHYHITNMLNDKGVPMFLKFCIWLSPQGPFHTDSVFAASAIALQSSLRAYLAAGLLLWMAQSGLSDPAVKASAIEAVGRLKADIFSTESLKSFKVDFKLKVLQERRASQTMKGKRDKEIKENNEEIEDHVNDPAEQIKALTLEESQKDSGSVKSAEEEEIEQLKNWVEKFTDLNEKVPNPYLSYSNLVQYLNANNEDGGRMLEQYTTFWEEVNAQLVM